MPRPLALLALSLLAITPLSAQAVGEYPVSLPQSSPALRQQRPSVAFSGRNYLVTWEEGDAVYSNLLDIHGRPLSGLATRISGSENAGNPHVAFVLDSYLVGWLSVPAGASSQVHISRVAPDTGEVVDTTRISIYGADSPFALDLKSDGTSALLVLAQGGGLTGVRLNRNGQVVDTLSLIPPGYSAGSPAVAWNGSEWLVAFEEAIYAGGQPLPYFYANIRAVRLSPSLTLLDPQPLPIAPGLKDFAPVVAASPDQFFIAWTHLDDSNGATTHGRYVPTVGEPGMDITPGTGSAESMVWDGERFALGVAVETSPSNFDLWATHVGVNDGVRDRLFIGRTTGDSPEFALFTTSGPVLAAYPRISFEPAYGGVTRIFIREPIAVIRGRATRH